MLATLLDELGIQGWKLELNSVGSAEDRKRYVEVLRQPSRPSSTSSARTTSAAPRPIPCASSTPRTPRTRPSSTGFPRSPTTSTNPSRDHFAQVCAALDACGVPYTINPRLVRGLDYYTRTTFEFTVPSSGDPASGLGTQNALLGGGRYDGLSEMLGGPRAPGIGFAIGEDRLILTLQAQAERLEPRT